jgi:transglutaminase-like putative cysteine protease
MKRIIKIFLALFIIMSLDAFAIDISKVLKASKKANRKNYPNAHFVLVDEEKIVEYEDNGEYSYEDEYYVKVLDEKGKDYNRILSLYYDKNYETAGFEFVKLIKSNGEIVKIDIKNNIQDKVSPSSQGSNIYDENERILTLNVPGIEVGDIIGVKEYSKVFKPRMIREFADYTYAENFYPIMSLKSIIKAPATNPLEVSEVLNPKEGKYSLNKKYVGNQLVYTFEVKDIAQIIPEPLMPPVSEIGMKWGVSTTAEWKDVSKWYYNLTEPKMQLTDNIVEITDELVEGLETDLEKIEKVFFWVSRNIRYLGITLEDNRPGLEPHDASYTCDSRTGVCRDKAALIVTMLRYLGYEADMVLMNASRKMEFEVPTSFFNHAIAGVELDGEYMLMDPTDETTKVLFPEYLMDKPYLPAKENGIELKYSPIKPADDNIVYITNKIDVQNEKYVVESFITFEGINDNAYRDYLIGLNEKQRKDFLRRVLKRMSTDIKLLDYKIFPEDLATAETLEIAIDYEVEDVVTGNEVKMLEIIKPGNHMGLYNWILHDLSLSKRKYPVRISSTAAIFELTEINYEGEILALPSKLSYHISAEDDRFNSGVNKFDYKVSYETIENTVKIVRYRRLNSLDYTLNDYYKLRKMFGTIENYEQKEIIAK